MQLPNFCFIVLVLASVFIMGCNGAAHGEACTENSNCTDAYQVCNTTCECDTGYTWSGTKCLADIAYGGNCSQGGSCAGDNTVCTGGTCRCSDGYYRLNDACAINIAYGGDCTEGGSCAGDNTVCTGGTCQCSSGYYRLNDACAIKIAFGGGCTQAGSCAGDNTVCTGGTCQCSDGYYRPNDACVIKVTTGNACPSSFSGSSEPCIDSNAVCNGNGYTCQCKAEYYNDGGTCAKKVAVSDSCPSNVSSTLPCVDTNAECTSTNNVYKSECKTGYFNNNGGCSLKLAVNQTCPSDVTSTLPCNDSNAECTNTNNAYKCACKNEYFNNNGLCSLKVAVDDSCPSTVASTLPCGDTNAECTNTNNVYTCECKNGYFNNNGECSLKLAVNQTCPSDVTPTLPCNDTNAECKNTNNEPICECKNGYFNNNGLCSLKIAVGQTCPSIVTSTLPCNDSNAECTNTNNDYKCECRNDYYNNAGVCSIKVDLGQSCTSNAACKGGNTNCSNNNCVCNTGYYDDTGTSDVEGSCIAKATLGDQCPAPTNAVPNTATCLDNIARCVPSGNNYKCLCPSTYYDSNGVNTVGGQCELKATLGDQCPAPTNAVPNTATCLDNIATCVSDGGTHKCLCPSTHYDNNGVNTGGGQCEPKATLGDQCPAPTNAVPNTATCLDSIARCVPSGDNYKCLCPSTHYDSNGVNTGGGQCLPKLLLGDVCPNPSTGVLSTAPCDDTYSTCQSETNTYRCRCTSDYYDDNGNNTGGGQCVLKVGLGSVCPMQDSCIKPNSQCVSDTCVCVSGYYDTNTANVPEGNCNKKKLLNAQCTERNWANYNKDQCSDQFARCNSNGYCTCNTGYHEESSVCVANKANGDVCTGSTDDECSDPNSECRNGKCTCKTSYYDNNGQAVGGKCESISQLQVGSFVFSNIQTTSFTVTWSLPAGSLSEFVNYYTVRWTLINQVDYDQSPVLASSETSYTVIGVKPGKAYEVEIVSHNTQTEDGVERTATVSKQQAAKPNIVKEITSSGNDLDVDINGLTIRYTPGDGGKSGYNVRLFDGETQIAENNPGQSATYVTLTNTNLKNDYSYTVKIKTKSELYDNGKKVESNEFEELLETNAKFPGKVTDFVVTKRPGGIYTQIKVSWKAPSERNSIIKEYRLVHNATQNNEWSTDVYGQHASMDYVYEKLLTVVPEMYYLIQVTAVNNKDVLGEISEILTLTPAGIPPNDVEQSRDIIYYQHDVKQTSFTVVLDKEFFQQDGLGVIRATGLIGCTTDKCNFNYRMSLSEFNSMASWTISSQNGYSTYRITTSAWLDNISRKKRRTTADMVNFPIGVDDCSNVPDNVYCNGPLSSGSSYTIVAIACTSGGCLLSKPYGPFQTLKELVCDCEPVSCNSDATAIIVGVVLGAIILVLLSFSGYLIVKLRRLSNKDQTKSSDVQQQPQYMNQLFLTAVSQSPDVENNYNSEDNYTSLNDETREDKSTYETL